MMNVSFLMAAVGISVITLWAVMNVCAGVDMLSTQMIKRAEVSECYGRIHTIKDELMFRGLIKLMMVICADIRECELSTHSCSHICIDLPGSYRCECRDGYALQEDGNSCTGEC